jgi:hypothetical protein
MKRVKILKVTVWKWEDWNRHKENLKNNQKDKRICT